MDNPTPYIVGGLASGAVIGMAAMGIVFTYKVSRVVNFAYGAIAMFCAYCYWQFRFEWGWTPYLSLPLTIVIIPAALALLSERFVYRRLSGTSVFARSAASIGVLLALFGLSQYFWHDDIANARIKAPLFQNKKIFSVLGTNISQQQVGIVACVAAVVLLLFVLLRFTTTGIALRAVVVNRDLAELRGISAVKVTQVAWIISYCLAAFAGVLFSAIIGGDATTLTLIVIASLAAGALGGLVSLPLAVVGGLVLGLASELVRGYQPKGELWSQARLTIPFLVLLVALVLRARALSGRDHAEGRTALLHDLAGAAYARHPNLKALAPRVALVLVVGVFLKLINYDFGIVLVSSGVAYGIIFLSYRVFTATTGMVSLAQGAFAGIGAFTVAGLSTGPGPDLPFAVALVVGGLVAGAAGVLVALPTIRLRGIFLALATIAFAQLVESVLFTRPSFTGGFSGKQLLRPWGFESNFAYFLLLLAVFCVAGYLCERFQYSVVGRELQADLGSSAGARSIGIRPERGRLVAFALAAMLAGMGGALLAAQVEYTAPADWGLILAFVWLVLVASGGLGSTGLMLQMGVLVSVLPEIIRIHWPDFSQAYVAIFGILGLIALRVPGGAAGIEERLAERVHRRRHRSDVAAPAATASP